MKDRLHSFYISETQEFSRRATLFDQHLKGMNWEKIRNVMVRQKHAWLELVSTVVGVKPASVFIEDELMSFNSMDFVPDNLKSNFFLHIKKDDLVFQGWLVDYEQLANVYSKYPGCFADFDFTKMGDKNYIEFYIDKRTTSTVGASKEDLVKTGLSLGYPYESVVNFSYDHSATPFEYKGYEFVTVESDIVPLKTWLKNIYEQSGMDAILAENEERIKKEYRVWLKSKKERIRIIRISGKKYLEIEFLDHERQVAGVQFVPVTNRELNRQESADMLSIFAERYKLSHLKSPKGGKCGVNYEDYVKNLVKSVTKTRVPYLTLDEGATDMKTGIAVIDRTELISWLNANGKNNLSGMFCA